jgi:hypothetical protein
MVYEGASVVAEVATVNAEDGEFGVTMLLLEFL